MWIHKQYQFNYIYIYKNKNKVSSEFHLSSNSIFEYGQNELLK
jgi:hypothetical protein